MGNGTSRCNDSMIDELVRRDRIITRRVERAFRLVDRGSFLPVGQRQQAYADVPIKFADPIGGPLHPGPLHLSTTDIYASVINQLDLRKGHAFLHIGSGVGYLSTITGLLLGENGTNHGIELYQNLTNYAEKRIDEWIATPGASTVGWVRPTLITCSVFNEKFLEKHANMYDRIYISFALSNTRIMCRVMRMLKIGGVLVAPSDTNLCRYVRVEEACVFRQTIAPTAFSRAIVLPVPGADTQKELPKLDKVSPLSHLARHAVRREIRKASFNQDSRRSISATILVNKGGTTRRELVAPRIRRRLNLFARHRDNDPVPEELPRELLYPINRNAGEVERSRHRATSWVNTEGFPETAAERTARSSRSSSTFSVHRSAADDSDPSTPDSDDWGEQEEHGEGVMNRQMNEFMAAINRRGGPQPNLAVLETILGGMNGPPVRLERQTEDLVLRAEQPGEAESPQHDPLFVDIVDNESAALDERRRPSGNLTDDDLPEESDVEEEKPEEPEKKSPNNFSSWLAADPQTEDEPSYSDYDLDEPSSSSSSGPSTSQPGSSSSHKRSIAPGRTHRQKRMRTEMCRLTKEEYYAHEREERENKCIRMRTVRDEVIANGASNFQERVEKLPIPANLRTFVKTMQHESLVQ